MDKLLMVIVALCTGGEYEKFEKKVVECAAEKDVSLKRELDDRIICCSAKTDRGIRETIYLLGMYKKFDEPVAKVVVEHVKSLKLDEDLIVQAVKGLDIDEVVKLVRKELDANRKQ